MKISVDGLLTVCRKASLLSPTTMTIRNPFTRGCALVRRTVKRAWLGMVGPRMVSAQTLSDEAFLAKFNIKEVLALVKQGDISAAKEALLAHYGGRVTAWPALPSPHNSGGYNDLSQEELVAWADSILHHLVLPIGSFQGQRAGFCRYHSSWQ